MLNNLREKSVPHYTIAGIILLITFIIMLFTKVPGNLRTYIPLINNSEQEQTDGIYALQPIVDLSQAEYGNILGAHIGKWSGINTTTQTHSLTADKVGADYLIKRDYTIEDYQQSNSSQTISVYIIQGKLVTIPNLYVSYFQTNGYKTESLGLHYLESSTIKWKNNYPSSYLNTLIPVERITISGGAGEELVEIIYIKGIRLKDGTYKKQATSILLQCLINGTLQPNDMSKLIDTFMVDFLPDICKITQVSEVQSVGAYLVEIGLWGYLIIFSFILLPILIIIIPILTSGKSKYPK